MPVYEFLCDRCGPFEIRRPLQEASSPLECPSCRATARRIYSAPAIGRLASALKRRIDRSAEPRLGGAPPAGVSPAHSHAGGDRPWQAGH